MKKSSPLQVVGYVIPHKNKAPSGVDKFLFAQKKAFESDFSDEIEDDAEELRKRNNQRIDSLIEQAKEKLSKKKVDDGNDTENKNTFCVTESENTTSCELNALNIIRKMESLHSEEQSNLNRLQMREEDIFSKKQDENLDYLIGTKPNKKKVKPRKQEKIIDLVELDKTHHKQQLKKSYCNQEPAHNIKQNVAVYTPAPRVLSCWDKKKGSALFESKQKPSISEYNCPGSEEELLKLAIAESIKTHKEETDATRYTAHAYIPDVQESAEECWDTESNEVDSKELSKKFCEIKPSRDNKSSRFYLNDATVMKSRLNNAREFDRNRTVYLNDIPCDGIASTDDEASETWDDYEESYNDVANKMVQNAKESNDTRFAFDCTTQIYKTGNTEHQKNDNTASIDGEVWNSARTALNEMQHKSEMDLELRYRRTDVSDPRRKTKVNNVRLPVDIKSSEDWDDCVENSHIALHLKSDPHLKYKNMGGPNQNKMSSTVDRNNDTKSVFYSTELTDNIIPKPSNHISSHKACTINENTSSILNDNQSELEVDYQFRSEPERTLRESNTSKFHYPGKSDLSMSQVHKCSSSLETFRSDQRRDIMSQSNANLWVGKSDDIQGKELLGKPDVFQKNNNYVDCKNMNTIGVQNSGTVKHTEKMGHHNSETFLSLMPCENVDKISDIRLPTETQKTGMTHNTNSPSEVPVKQFSNYETGSLPGTAKQQTPANIPLNQNHPAFSQNPGNMSVSSINPDVYATLQALYQSMNLAAQKTQSLLMQNSGMPVQPRMGSATPGNINMFAPMSAHAPHREEIAQMMSSMGIQRNQNISAASKVPDMPVQTKERETFPSHYNMFTGVDSHQSLLNLSSENAPIPSQVISMPTQIKDGQTSKNPSLYAASEVNRQIIKSENQNLSPPSQALGIPTQNKEEVPLIFNASVQAAFEGNQQSVTKVNISVPPIHQNATKLMPSVNKPAQANTFQPESPLSSSVPESEERTSPAYSSIHGAIPSPLQHMFGSVPYPSIAGFQSRPFPMGLPYYNNMVLPNNMFPYFTPFVTPMLGMVPGAVPLPSPMPFSSAMMMHHGNGRNNNVPSPAPPANSAPSHLQMDVNMLPSTSTSGLTAEALKEEEEEE